MRNPTGYAQVVDPDRPVVERDTCSCGHCGRVIFTKPHTVSTVYLVLNRQTLQWEEVPGAFCRVCMRPVCLACDAHGRCTPWERRLAESEARDRLRRAATL
jgi:hypothetical protein